MNEYLTDAVVLDKENAGELDSLIYLYTKDLGKVVAKAKSSRKITSKLSGHLEPLNLVKVRLVEKNGFQAVDALALKKFSAKFLRVAEFIKEMTFECQADLKLWLLIKKILAKPEIEEKIIYRSLLKALGFDPKFAECANCRKKEAYAFSPEEQKFLCRKCSMKIPKNEVIFI
jgi:DNA repair protein RecO